MTSSLMQCDARDLLRLLRVAEHGSINRAAAALNISQPALTRRIRQLEDLVGGELVRRSPAGVSLTPLGKRICAHARKIEAELRKIVPSTNAGQVSELNIGTTPLPATLLLPEGIKILKSRRPNMSILISENFMDKLCDRLKEGQIDAVLGSQQFDDRDSNLAYFPLFGAHICIVSGKAPSKSGRIKLADLAKRKWVLPLRNSAPYRKRVEREFERRKLTLPVHAVEAPSVPAIMRIAIGSDTVTALPEEAIVNELRSGVLVKLNGDWQFPSYTYGLFVRREAMRSLSTRDLLASMREAVTALKLPSPLGGYAPTA